MVYCKKCGCEISSITGRDLCTTCGGGVMEEKKSKPEFIKMIIDQFTDEEKKEFAELISKDMPAQVKNKIELQVG